MDMNEGIKVLIVDDEEEFASTLAERLRLRGFLVRVAADGESALRLVSADHPRVVVLDVIMPGIGGLQILFRIRSDYPQIPVILLTGKGSTKEGIEGMQLGAFDYLTKPIDIEELASKIREAAGGD